MSGTVAKLHRRLRAGVRRGAFETTSPESLRMVLRELLFDGEDVPDWRRAAACQDTDPETFYPPHGWAAPIVTEAAKKVCAGCPVRAACLVDALSWERPNERHGVLGGLTGPERAQLAERITSASSELAGGASA